jgi:hypothetical protein
MRARNAYVRKSCLAVLLNEHDVLFTILCNAFLHPYFQGGVKFHQLLFLLPQFFFGQLGKELHCSPTRKTDKCKNSEQDGI